MSQGLFATLVADMAPANLRGTAFGAFNLFAGVAMLAASVIAGVLWTCGVRLRPYSQARSSRGRCLPASPLRKFDCVLERREGAPTNFHNLEFPHRSATVTLPSNGARTRLHP
jgi:hypothetical protein